MLPATRDRNEEAMKQDSLIDAEQNREMFDQIARRYDLMNRIVSLGMDRGWRKKAVDALELKPGGRYLDVGVGTGDLSWEILSRHLDNSIIGIDHSPSMLDFARQKLSRMGGAGPLTIEEGDALNLQYDDNSFDGVISGFVLRNLVDRVKGLAEMARVTKKNGNVVLLELAIPGGGLMKNLYKVYNSTFVPVIARALSRGAAYQYLVDSIADFPHPDEVLQMTEKAGFDKMSYLPLSRGIVSLFVGTPKK